MKHLQVVPVLSVVNNQVITSSKDVAKFFEKRHDHVIRDIDDIIEKVPESFAAPNFGANKINVLNNPSGEEISHYTLTRDGFTILAMGFTGKRAMQFKVAYIEAFNRMEAELMHRDPTLNVPALNHLTDELFSICKAYEKAHGWSSLCERIKRLAEECQTSQLPATTLTPDQQRKVQQLIGEKVYGTGNKAMYPTYFKHVYRAIKDRFNVGKYDQVPATQFHELTGYIQKIEIGEPVRRMPVGENALLHAEDIFFMAGCINEKLRASTESLFLVQQYMGRIIQDACMVSPEVFDETKRRFRLTEKEL